MLGTLYSLTKKSASNWERATEGFKCYLTYISFPTPICSYQTPLGAILTGRCPGDGSVVAATAMIAVGRGPPRHGGFNKGRQDQKDFQLVHDPLSLLVSTFLISFSSRQLIAALFLPFLRSTPPPRFVSCFHVTPFGRSFEHTRSLPECVELRATMQRRI